MTSSEDPSPETNAETLEDTGTVIFNFQAYSVSARQREERIVTRILQDNARKIACRMRAATSEIDTTTYGQIINGMGGLELTMEVVFREAAAPVIARNHHDLYSNPEKIIEEIRDNVVKEFHDPIRDLEEVATARKFLLDRPKRIKRLDLVGTIVSALTEARYTELMSIAEEEIQTRFGEYVRRIDIEDILLDNETEIVNRVRMATPETQKRRYRIVLNQQDVKAFYTTVYREIIVPVLAEYAGNLQGARRPVMEKVKERALEQYGEQLRYIEDTATRAKQFAAKLVTLGRKKEVRRVDVVGRVEEILSDTRYKTYMRIVDDVIKREYNTTPTHQF